MDKRFKVYWMCHSDQWHIIPILDITFERVGRRLILGAQVGFLKRWCAVEFYMKEVING